jgi:hypothetical protein
MIRMRSLALCVALAAFPTAALAQTPEAVTSPAPAPSAAATVPTPPPSVNLPMPRHSCPTVIAGMHLKKSTPLNADSLGLMYASALKLNGVVGQKKIALSQLIQAYSDTLGCFVTIKK